MHRLEIHFLTTCISVSQSLVYILINQSLSNPKKIAEFSTINMMSLVVKCMYWLIFHLRKLLNMVKEKCRIYLNLWTVNVCFRNMTFRNSTLGLGWDNVRPRNLNPTGMEPIRRVCCYVGLNGPHIHVHFIVSTTVRHPHRNPSYVSECVGIPPIVGWIQSAFI